MTITSQLNIKYTTFSMVLHVSRKLFVDLESLEANIALYFDPRALFLFIQGDGLNGGWFGSVGKQNSFCL